MEITGLEVKNIDEAIVDQIIIPNLQQIILLKVF